MVTGIAVLALATVAGAQGYAFNTNLTVGSRGTDVSTLQTWLIANGYSIPSVQSGAAAKGYFGSQTKTAVMQFQAAKGLPSTGFVGPLTRGVLNAGGVSVTVGGSTCPAGYTCTVTSPVAVTCPVGFTCTANPGTTGTVTGAPMGITTPGVAGTLAVSLQSTPSNGTTLSKGQSADVAAYKVQAGASDMQITSIQIDFSNRMWLYAGDIKISDGSTVVAEKSGLTSNDFTELTVGSDYRLTLPVSGYVVPRATTKYLTVNVSMLPVSDRSSGTISISNAIVRSVDGTGVTDTETYNTTARTFSYTGSNNGSVVVTVDSASPLQGVVQISTANQTDMVPLAVYDVKSQNISTTLRSLTLVPHTNGPGVTQLFGDIKIKAAGLTYSADSISSTSVAFTNLQIPLAADTYVPLTVYGKINQDTSNALDGAMASTSWVVAGTAGGTSNNPDVEDQSYTALANTSGTFVSSDLTYSANSAVLSGLSSSVGTCIQGPDGSVSVSVACPVTYQFTLTAGNSTLYVSGNPGIALATTSTGYSNTGATNASSTITVVTANPSTLPGDNTSAAPLYYVIPAGGSRQFTYTGQMKNEKNTGPTSRTFAISAVKYGTAVTSDTTLSANSINYNLGALKASTVI